jgi:short-subunit dehydrogenase
VPSIPSYRSALITGASSGIGRALALWFARRGTIVWAAGRRHEALDTLVEEARSTGGRVLPFALDVADTEATVRLVRTLDEECGGLDLVVANAGISVATDGRRLDWSDVERILQVNVLGAAATLSAALPAMVSRGRGHLVGVSSLASWRGMPRFSAYCGSKAFLSVFLEGLRVDLRRVGVRVTSIHPGYVKSEITAGREGRMTFLLETDDAADRMGRAILRGDRVFSFPWQLQLVARLVRGLPDGLFDRLARGNR